MTEPGSPIRLILLLHLTKMYNRRVEIFIAFSALLLLVCILRLAQMQLLPNSRVQDAIAELKRQRGQYQQLKTLRGKILDRNGKVLALDEPRFELHIDYSLTRFVDERVREAKLIKARRQNNTNILIPEVQKQLQTGYEDLQRIIYKCIHFGLSRDEIEDRINQINDKIWNLRRYLAWKRNYPDRDFEQAVPDANEQILLTAAVDIAEMHKSWPLLELNTDDDIFAAQVEFMDIEGIEISPQGHRFYPYGSVAAQTIGWVGPATQEQDKELFANDRLASYTQGEVCGREDGVEYVCEAILRGRRGELIYDIDRQLISRTETQFGKDVRLTLDIELQQRIEEYLANYNHNPGCGPGMAVVILEVATGDILALASLPVFDLNRARYDYSQLVGDPNKPLINRAINKQYPPGSVVKPLILIAGLESGNITADEVIECPAEKAPFGWPNCWIYNRHRDGHSNRWQNYARNAVRGSCNIYFSRLADRIEPLVLQQWLFKFGYGRCTRLASCVVRDASNAIRNTQYAIRDLRQVPGQISSVPSNTSISSFEQVPILKEGERRLFGIGQGNLRATPLQVANAMAAIARGGVYKPPRLFLEDKPIRHSERSEESLSSFMPDPSTSSQDDNLSVDSTSLSISPQTLEVIYDGMQAVINEPGGTAYEAFAYSGFAEQDVKVYGKTGSTEKPDNAWFGGFAEDSDGSKVAIALVVEGGQHGSSDAAPLGRDIIQFCIESGYLGRAVP